jgi:hypothetical protein
MAASGEYKQYWRIRTEASFAAATPEGGAEWNIGGNGGGANGWVDLPISRDSNGLQPKSTIVYPSVASGSRAMNAALPVAGAYPTELGSLESEFYPELADRILYLVMGSASRTQTAGSAALASTAFASVATLDTQPNGTEQLKFVISSSTAASAAAINIIQSGATQETITIGTSAATVDGTYYSKGAYNGSTNAVTFSVSGTVTAGTVVVSGVDYTTNVFSAGSTNPSAVIEQGGRPEAGSGNSEFFNGVVVPTAVLTYDRAAVDNMLMLNTTFQGLYDGTATAGAYAQDAASHYKPFAGWTGALTIDGASWAEVASASITLQPNTRLYATSSGNQNPSGKTEGYFEVFGTMNLIPDGNSRWADYRAATVRDVNLTFTTPFYVVDTTAYSLSLDFTQLTFSDYSRDKQQGALGAPVGFRAIYNSTDGGPCKITTVCRMPV